MTMIRPEWRPKAPPASAPPLTMASLVAAAESDQELPPTRRRDICSAIRRLCEVLGLEPETVPVSRPFLRRRLEAFHPVQASMSRKTFQNVRSAVDFAFKRYATDQAPERQQPLSTEWQTLWEALPAGDIRYGLSRFIRFCSNFGIGPWDVSDVVAERFLSWLRDETLVRKPEALWRRNIVLWNKAVRTVPGWPQILLSVPSNKNCYTLAWEELPLPFRRDAEAWLDCLENADPFSGDPFTSGPWRKPVRPATLKTRRFQIRQLVSALHIRGYDIQTFTSLSDLVAIEAARDALRFFHDRNGKETSSQIAGLAITLASIAGDWCKVEPQHLKALAALKHNLAYTVKGLTPKNRARLRQFADEHNLLTFLGLAQHIFYRVRRKNHPSRKDLLDMQVALAIEFLLMAPIRRVNFVKLRLGPEGHVILPPKGRKGPIFVSIPGHEVKNELDLEFPLPPETVELLRFYVEKVRPFLAEDPGPWLIPGAFPGAHKSLDQFSHHFTKTIRRLTGLDLNLHLMRHLGAKLYLDENPGAYETVRRVLGHRRLSTTVNSYTGLESEAAFRHFQQVVLGIRDSIRKEVGDD